MTEAEVTTEAPAEEPAEAAPEAPVEPELPVLVADEVEHRQARLAFGQPQPPPELLQEHRRAVGRPNAARRR